jgi:hypothetical protein
MSAIPSTAAASRSGAVHCTRLADLANTIDPKLVADASGMNPEGVILYLADHVARARLPALR